ncbi:MAG: hypothetical protein ACI8YQ_003279 [Polaribacter sp.]|jgi:hypothetical protein
MKSTSITYQMFSISMAILMFFTSAGFTVDMHYCQGKLKTISFFGKAKSCHEIGEGMKNCPHHKKMMEEKAMKGDMAKEASEKDCCSNKTLHFQSDQDQQYQVNNAVVVSAQLQHFVIAFVESFFKSAVSETGNPTYAHYKPPLIPKDIYVLLETYRL